MSPILLADVIIQCGKLKIISKFNLLHCFAHIHHSNIHMNPNYQTWETECKCGRSEEDDNHEHFDDNPWIAQIYENRNEVIIPICLGSLISHRHVLTSKHCFGNAKAGGNDWELKGRSQLVIFSDSRTRMFLFVFVSDLSSFQVSIFH